MTRVRVAGVVVPARDEAELLPGALAALRVAAAAARAAGVTVDLLVVADSCTDATPELALAAGVRVLPVSAGSVGPARAAGLRDILGRHPTVPTDQLWLASTDADSRVPPYWLTGHLDLADAGADLVVGTVEVDDWSAHPSYVEARWRAGYDPRDGHGHVHGANVGVRADAYLAVGGFALSTGTRTWPWSRRSAPSGGPHRLGAGAHQRPPDVPRERWLRRPPRRPGLTQSLRSVRGQPRLGVDERGVDVEPRSAGGSRWRSPSYRSGRSPDRGDLVADRDLEV